MRFSATRLRWLLLSGVFLLAAVVAGFFGLARYRAGKIWQHILARNGVNLRRESNGITWSQSSKGRTIFTLHASKAVPEGNNKWTLHDAVLILYGREHGRDDRIYGSQFSYDQNQEVLRALGEVHMDLQAPEPGGKAPPAGTRADLGFGREDPAALDPSVIHVRTSGLVYMRKMGIAATGELTEFRYGGITCTSNGAEFDSEHSLVRLLANVKLTGQTQRAPFTLTAAHAELDRTASTADLAAPVLMSKDRAARAGHALLHLHKDGSLQAAEASGDVEMRASTQVISSPQMTAVFGDNNHAQHARLFTGVSFSDSASGTPSQGRANTMDLDWASSGELSGITANGAVTYSSSSTGQAGAAEQRGLRAEAVVATFLPGARRHSVLRRVRLTGGAELETATAATKSGSASATRVAGDELITDFAPGSTGTPLAQHLSGAGHTELTQDAADGSRRKSTGDTLEVSLGPKGGTISAQVQVTSAVQSGHVVLQETAAPKTDTERNRPEVTTGHADKATYSLADALLTLSAEPGSHASLQQLQGELSASTISLHEGSGDADANGDVTATSAEAGGGPGTHIVASRARLLHAQNLSQFYGAPGRLVQLWQGGSQVQAAEITVDNKTHQMAARPEAEGGRVHAIFVPAADRNGASASKERGAGPKTSAALGAGGGEATQRVPEAERNTIDVTAGRMDFDEEQHEAVFGGNVRMRNVLGEVTADRGVAFLKQQGARPASGVAPGKKAPGTDLFGTDLSGSLERFVMLGNVRLQQPGRLGTGEQLTYTATTDSFALTGTSSRPPRVTGEQGGVITGATLLFQGADSTIVVAGSKGDAKVAGPARVHTETDLKP